MVSGTLDTVDLNELDDEEIDALFEADEEDQAEATANSYLRRAQEYDNTGGTVTIYHTLDGMPVEILSYMRRQTLKMRREDGKRRFSTKPLMEYKLGSLPCMLNETHPMNPRFREAGISTSCRKVTLRTATDVRRHMERTHKDENRVYWDMVEQEREDRREAQLERQLQMQEQQNAMLARILEGQQGQPAVVLTEEPETDEPFEDPMFPQPKTRGRPKGS